MHLVIIVVASFCLIFELERLRNEAGPRVRTHVQLAKPVQVLNLDGRILSRILFLQGKVKGACWGGSGAGARGMQSVGTSLELLTYDTTAMYGPCTLMVAFSMLSEWPPPPPTRYANSSLPPSTSVGIATSSDSYECGASDVDKGTHWPPPAFRAYTMPFWLPWP